MAVNDPNGIVLLTHHPLGIRVELSFDLEGALELWISPKAESSADYWDRNFSNRDDHTRLFERIRLHGLSKERFRSCDYDPFHMVARFEGQTLHLVPLLGTPALALWFEAEQTLDFKSDKVDAPLEKLPHRFSILHPDRGYNFEYVAATAHGATSFRHHLHHDRGRSFYAMATLPAGQALIIGGGLVGEGVIERVQGLAEQTPALLLAANEAALGGLLEAGRFELRDLPDLQRLLDKNRRILLAMQDPQGAIRAALNRIYYMIWVRDGAIIEAFQAYSGRPEEIRRWADFLLKNPTRIDDPRAAGTTWTMLVNPITKWEEDGVFYAIWSAFTAWTQTGDERYVRGQNATLLAGAMAWMERYIFDAERGLFGRYYACETCFEGSRDSGYDHAIGLPVPWPPFRQQGGIVRRSYDLYINQLAYASYRMLAAIHGPTPAGQDCVRKAADLAAHMETWFEGKLPDYGDLLLDDGRLVRSGAKRTDLTDWVWALSVGPFSSVGYRRHAVRAAAVADALAEPLDHFLAGWFSLLASTDPLHLPEADVREAIQRAAQRCHRPGKFLAMPDSVVEMMMTEDGDPWHDVRPQAFSVGPWLATMTGRVLQRLPFGLAVRPTGLVKRLHRYDWRNHQLSLVVAGSGSHITRWSIDGQEIFGTYQIPEERLRTKSVLELCLGDVPASGPVWIESSMTLLALQVSGSQHTAKALAHGQADVVLRGGDAAGVVVRDGAGSVIVHQTQAHGRDLEIRFVAWGPVEIAYAS